MDRPPPRYITLKSVTPSGDDPLVSLPTLTAGSSRPQPAIVVTTPKLAPRRRVRSAERHGASAGWPSLRTGAAKSWSSKIGPSSSCRSSGLRGLLRNDNRIAEPERRRSLRATMGGSTSTRSRFLRSDAPHDFASGIELADGSLVGADHLLQVVVEAHDRIAVRKDYLRGPVRHDVCAPQVERHRPPLADLGPHRRSSQSRRLFSRRRNCGPFVTHVKVRENHQLEGGSRRCQSRHWSPVNTGRSTHPVAPIGPGTNSSTRELRCPLEFAYYLRRSSPPLTAATCGRGQSFAQTVTSEFRPTGLEATWPD